MAHKKILAESQTTGFCSIIIDYLKQNKYRKKNEKNRRTEPDP